MFHIGKAFSLSPAEQSLGSESHSQTVTRGDTGEKRLWVGKCLSDKKKRTNGV